MSSSIRTAVLFAAVASSSLVVGACLGVRVRPPKRLLAVALAFAAGALITALAFELCEESQKRAGLGRAVAGLAAGAVVFTALRWWLDRPERRLSPGAQRTVDAGAEDSAPNARARRDRATALTTTRPSRWQS